MIPAQEIRAIVPDADVRAFAPPAEVDALVPVADLAAVAPVAEVGALTPGAELLAFAPLAQIDAIAPAAELGAFAPVSEVDALAPVFDLRAFAPVAQVAALSPFVGGFADPSDLWVQKFIVGDTVGIPPFTAYARVAASPDLFTDTFGSPTKAQQFMAVLSGLDRIGQAIECAQDDLIDSTFPSLRTSTTTQFPAGSKVRLWVKSPAAVRGSGGRGGDGGCEDGAGKASSERAGGGGGGAGARTFFFADPLTKVGGAPGINQCHAFGGPHGEAGEREIGGLGNDSILTPAASDEASSDGFIGYDAMELADHLGVFNEGKIYAGGGGGAGANSDGFGAISNPGDGGTPGVAGEDATVKTGLPDLRNGGAPGLAVKKNGNVLTWLADPYSDETGSMGDVLGAIA